MFSNSGFVKWNSDVGLTCITHNLSESILASSTTVTFCQVFSVSNHTHCDIIFILIYIDNSVYKCQNVSMAYKFQNDSMS